MTACLEKGSDKRAENSLEGTMLQQPGQSSVGGKCVLFSLPLLSHTFSPLLSLRLSPTHPPSLLAAATMARVHSCPVCNEPFHGDMAAFESHVNAHFFTEDRLGPKHDPKPPSLVPLCLAGKSTGTQGAGGTFLVQCEAEGCYERGNQQHHCLCH